ncbi:MAG: ABC transporter permease [Thermohalobaculum sp.]
MSAVDPIAIALDDDLPARPPGALRIMMRDRRAFFGLMYLGILLTAAVFAPWIAPYDPNAMDYVMLEAPSWSHPLGVDDLGRDLLSRIIHGARVSIFVGLSTVAIAGVLGVIMGISAAFYRGWIDTVIMRYIDLQWAFPNILIAVYLVATFGTGLLNVIIAISLAYLDDFARVTRGMTLSVKEEQYVTAARAIGCSDWRIMARHILPNITAPVIVLATVSISNAILAEAVLSFLGLGVGSDTPTWGLILAEARSFITRAWWLGVFPGLAIMLTVLSINFLGDSLRDLLDVRETRDIP